VGPPWRLTVDSASKHACSHRTRRRGPPAARYKIDATNSPIRSGGCDYRNARRIIKGVDQAARMAQYATTIEGILIDAIVR